MKINKYLVVFLSFLILVTSGCKKGLDINKDPDYPELSAATPSIVFPAAVMSTAGRVGGDLTILGGIWSQYWTQAAFSNQYKYIDGYEIHGSDFNASYSELFAGALNDYQTVITTSKNENKWLFYLMGTVMKAYTYQVLVDLYDQVPYSEAFQGVKNLQPKFDDGYSIYTGLIKEIDTALSKDLTAYTNTTSENAADLVFSGSVSKWVAFANTLKLKMYLRMINAKPTEAEAGVKALFSGGASFLTTDAGIFSFKTDIDKQNPFYAYNVVKLNVSTNLRASKTFVSWLLDNSDPRVITYFGSSNPGNMNQGDFLNANTANGSAKTPVQSATDPVVFISTAESYLMQAEALERYYAGSGAKAKYDAGVTASFTATSQSVGTLLTGNYAYKTSGTMADRIEQIIVQKWASFAYGCHALEAFFEKNRTGFPRTSAVYSDNSSYISGQIVYSKNGVTGAGNFPKRLLFPDNERSTNSNTPGQVPLTTKVWWGL
jgi:hypothetical protein